ncbi:hypothetical protein SANT12839_052560 [Streptomyces antimycoticus]|uniref:Uncharacterized protein n=1 Tax=Streptomyces antimycoticus TaxID=68175 RepID=A0A4D4K8C4_9ACTN|nr:hypothetical protein SANT12839_052560 [Streptomyces antimycoticus]
MAAEAATGTGHQPHPHIAEQRARAQDAPTEGATTPPAQDGLYAPLEPDPASAQPLPTPAPTR